MRDAAAVHVAHRGSELFDDAQTGIGIELASALGEEKKEEEKRKLMDERVREEVQKMLRENGAEYADRESGSEKQVNDEEISDKTQK